MSLSSPKIHTQVDFTKWHFGASEEETLDSFIGKIVQDTFQEVWAEDPPCAMMSPTGDPDKILIFPFGGDCCWEFSLSEIINDDDSDDIDHLTRLRDLLQTLADKVDEKLVKERARQEDT